MADIERILANDSGKVAFEKTDRNMVKVDDKLSISLARIGDLAALPTTSKSDLVSAIKEEYNRMNVLKDDIGVNLKGYTSSTLYKVGEMILVTSNSKHETFILSGGGEETVGYCVYVCSIDARLGGNISVNMNKIIGTEQRNDEFEFNVVDNKLSFYVRTARYHSATPFTLRPLGNGNMTYKIEALSSNLTGLIKVTPKIVATTDKVDILLPYNSGFEQMGYGYESKLEKVNNLVTIKFGVKRVGDVFFEAQTAYAIATLPSGYMPISRFATMGSLDTDPGGDINGVKIFVEGNVVYVKPIVKARFINFIGSYYTV